MLSKFKAMLVTIAAIAGLILAAFFKGRSSGKEVVREEVRQQEVKDVKAVVEERVKVVKKVNDVQKDVISNSDKSVDDELLNNWTRPDSGK